MIPDPLTLAVLIGAAYRLTRLVGWDDFPLAARVRAKVIGERWIPLENISLAVLPRAYESQFPRPEMQEIGRSEDNPPSLPGKQPSSEAEGVRPAYDRPTLAHLVHCPFCVGWWISLLVYLGWLAEPRWALYATVPFAISGAVGLISKNLDP